MSVVPPRRNRSFVEPGPERALFSDSSILHGHPPVVRTSSQLRLEEILQGANHTLAQADQRSGQLTSSKFQDAKPRLLLMGLRRCVLGFSL
jgi:Ras-related GTP-binding protein C/D